MFYSQDDQDKYLEEKIFRGYRDGIFIDVGAFDGKTINNTLYFEETNNWRGINIEPIPNVYDQLVINRPKSININCAVCNNNGETEFICSTGLEVLSGIKDTYDPRHCNRLLTESQQTGATTQLIKVQTRRLEAICDEHNITHINYLSIDVEGGEFNVIKSINFDKVFIDIIAFENNYNDVSIPIVKYLEDKGFIIIKSALDIFMINRKSQFYKSPNTHISATTM